MMDSREYKLLSELKQWRCKKTKGDGFLGNDFQTQFLSLISFLKHPLSGALFGLSGTYSGSCCAKHTVGYKDANLQLPPDCSFSLCSDPQCNLVALPQADVSEGTGHPINTSGPSSYQPHLISP